MADGRLFDFSLLLSSFVRFLVRLINTLLSFSSSASAGFSAFEFARDYLTFWAASVFLLSFPQLV